MCANKTVIEEINQLFGMGCSCGCRQLNGLQGLTELYAELESLNAKLKDRHQRKGECSKYIFKRGRNDCLKKVNSQISDINDQINATIKQIEVFQQQGGSNSSGTGNSSDSGTGADLIPNQQQAGFNSNLILIGVAVFAGIAMMKTKSVKPENKLKKKPNKTTEKK